MWPSDDRVDFNLRPGIEPASSIVINIGIPIWVMAPSVNTVANTIGMRDNVRLTDGAYPSVNIGLEDTSLYRAQQTLLSYQETAVKIPVVADNSSVQLIQALGGR